jgi:RNA polymerase sigma factor (sigma-70 family)
MPKDETSSETEKLKELLSRLKAGDRQARGELVSHSYNQIERLTRKLLRNHPAVRRWEQTLDVSQNAAVRLLNALMNTTPETVEGYFALAAQQIRRELIDLARKHTGPLGMGTNLSDAVIAPSADDSIAPAEPSADNLSAVELARWAGFHAAVERLPLEDRETVSLVYYHGWTQVQIAELFGVDERTIRRRWNRACEKLRDQLGVDYLNE